MPPSLRLAVFAGVAAMMSLPALAETYPTCAQARGIVLRQGAAVIRTAPNIYDRYVVSRAYCQPTEHVARTFVATRDTPACFIGYVCKEGSFWEDF